MKNVGWDPFLEDHAFEARAPREFGAVRDILRKEGLRHGDPRFRFDFSTEVGASLVRIKRTNGLELGFAGGRFDDEYTLASIIHDDGNAAGGSVAVVTASLQFGAGYISFWGDPSDSPVEVLAARFFLRESVHPMENRVYPYIFLELVKEMVRLFLAGA